MNRTRLAKRLGVCGRTLRRLEASSPLYVPAASGLPGLPNSILKLYHPEQVQLIEAVMLGLMDLEEAMLRWRLFLARARVEIEPLPREATPGKGDATE
jgi:hypothetical protein